MGNNAVNITRSSTPAQRLSSRTYAVATEADGATDDYVKQISISHNDYPEPTHLGDIELPKMPENARIKAADYVSSAVRPDQLPKDNKTEIAVIGRSNVGKSSLINAITNKHGLAMVSKTPGK